MADIEKTYQLVIDCEQESGEIKRLYLDTCKEKSITSSAEIAQQPLQSGKVMSDHMYSLPDTYTISGTFSLYGNIHDDYDDFEGVPASTDRLTNIENVFEYIKDNGLLCNLIMLDTSIASGSVRFKARKGMALKTITWKEKLASVDYSLNFVEILTVDMQMPDVSLADYPETIMPSSRSLGQLIVEAEDNDIAKMILTALYNGGYIKKEDCKYFWHIGHELDKSVAIGLGTFAVGILTYLGSFVAGVVVYAIGAAAISIIVGTTGAVATIFPVGTVIAAAAAFIAGMVCAIMWQVNAQKEEYRRKMTFNLVNNISSHVKFDANGDPIVDYDAIDNDPSCTLNNNDINKLLKLISDVKTAIINYSDGVSCYAISSGLDDNSSRTVVLTINDWPYYVDITKDENAKYGWRFSVSTLNSTGDRISLTGGYGMEYNNSTVVTELYDCDLNTNCFFTDRSFENYVYIYNPSLSAEISDTQEKFEAVKHKLCGYQIIVCKGNMQDKIDKINSIIDDVIKSRGYI